MITFTNFFDAYVNLVLMTLPILGVLFFIGLLFGVAGAIFTRLREWWNGGLI
jgi:hypothetical protein